jgi:hypothetical protein
MNKTCAHVFLLVEITYPWTCIYVEVYYITDCRMKVLKRDPSYSEYRNDQVVIHRNKQGRLLAKLPSSRSSTSGSAYILYLRRFLRFSTFFFIRWKGKKLRASDTTTIPIPRHYCILNPGAYPRAHQVTTMRDHQCGATWSSLRQSHFTVKQPETIYILSSSVFCITARSPSVWLLGLHSAASQKARSGCHQELQKSSRAGWSPKNTRAPGISVCHRLL